MDKTAQAYIAYMGVFIGSITFTIVFPFANEMVMSFGVVSDKDKTGTYVGIMASSLMFSRTISSPFWGYVIDKWGRKKVTQFSLISSLVLCFVFGLSNNFVFAVVIRFLIGALTPITISSRTILGDLFKGREASSGMAGFSIAWGMGSVSGGFLGGILANKAYINTRLGWVFVEYPFLLVNLVPSLMSLVALVLGELYLRDDLVKNEENLIESNSRNMKELLLDTKLLVLLSMSFLLSYNSTGFQELIVLFFWAKRDSGGLEINTQQIGYITGGSALLLLLFQKPIYMAFVNKIGNLSLCKGSFIIFPAVTILMPLSSFIENQYLRHTCVVLLVIFLLLLDFFIFTSVLVFSSNAVGKKELGKLNGLVLMVNCLGRMLSPITIGAFFAYTIDSTVFFPLNYASSFLLLIAIQFIGLFAASKIDPESNKEN